MGCWGMGITQSDEYCEIYERFIEEYDEDLEIDEYIEEFLRKREQKEDDLIEKDS